MSGHEYPLWVTVGLLGQAFFFSRFIVQWAVSERRKESVVPVAFWYLSIVGSLLLLTYGIADRDPVIIIGNLPNAIVYIRNLMLIRRRQREVKESLTDNIKETQPETLVEPDVADVIPVNHGKTNSAPSLRRAG